MVQTSQSTISSKFGDIIKLHTAPFICSLLLTIILILDEIGILPIGRSAEYDVKIAFSTAFLASGALGIFVATRDNISVVIRQIATGVTAVLVIAIGLLSSWFLQSPLFLYPGLGLLIMAAPFLRQQSNEDAVWLYNSRFATAIVLSIIASLLFGGGLYAITSSLDFLLGFNVHREVYDIIWILAIAFVGPVFGLYLMPKDSREALILPDNTTLLARGISVLINYVLTPMLIVYLIILHLYAAKILITFSLPKGQVALMVLIFSLGLTGFILFARPWAERSTKLTNWLLKYWHLLLFTPLVLLAISVTRRISDYGVTPERYMLVILGIWLFALLILPLFKKMQLGSVRILGSLAAILIVVSFGPWGAKSISVKSQKTQLIQLLERYDMLENDRLKTDLVKMPEYSSDDSTKGHSIVRFMSKNDGLASLKPLFVGHPDDPFKITDNTRRQWELNNRITKFFGFSYKGLQATDSVSYNAANFKAINIEAYRTYIPGLLLRNYNPRPSSERLLGENRVWREETEIFIETQAGNFKVDAKTILELVKKTNKEVANNQDKPIIQVQLNGNSGKATLLVSNMSAQYKDDKLQYIDINFDLLIE